MNYKKIVQNFGLFVFVLILFSVSWQWLNIDSKCWDFLIFFLTLELMIFITRLIYFIVVRFGVNGKISMSGNKGVLSKIDEKPHITFDCSNDKCSGTRVIGLTYKPIKYMAFPIEGKMSYTLNGTNFFVKESIFFHPYIPVDFAFDSSDMQDIIPNKDGVKIRIWYKADVGFYSEWNYIDTITG